jgi:iron complex outermembrane recepter protein
MCGSNTDYSVKLWLTILSLLIVPGAYAETADSEGAIDESGMIEEMIVTGSRIRRDEFSSPSPIQIIDGAGSREIGLIDTASLLQSATQATGQQIDSTFTAFVLDNGPGSNQVNLRGLGAERVLVLLNGRRVAPGGVGGAPTSPDISTLPNIMIDRIEYLLDGASSVYGSDAVAGVANVIMRTDFEGFEFESEIVDTDNGGGDEKTLGLAWGKSGDNWNFGIAGEYYDRDSVQLSDRDYTEQCNRNIYEGEDGKELNDYLGLVPGTTLSPCKLSTINRVFIPIGYGNVWYTPGFSNIGIPNLSETEVDVGFTGFNPGAIVPTDIDGDGIPDTGLIDPDGNGLSDVDIQSDQYNYNGSGRDRAGDLLTEAKRINIYTYGEYEFLDDANTSVYFEALYSKRETKVFSPGATIFPDVPATNPYNPCNRNGVDGVNCIGFFGGLDFGDLETTPIVAIRNDRDNFDVEIEQYRWVGGVKGDLPFLQSNSGGFGNWSYDVYASYSTSDGKDKGTGILEAQLLNSLATSAIDPNTGNVVCGEDANNDGIPDGNGCVPVNMYAPSIYQPGGGTFATQAERDYVFGVRSFDTEVDQTILSGVVQGDLFLLPWNDTAVPLVFGLEYRKDEIDSQPNDVARDGAFYAFFADRGAKGDRNIKEVFLETEFQLLEGVQGAEELSLNLAARWTEESTYGSDTTYSVKTLYTPVDGLTFRGTYGTSFRAPNAQEQFLLGQSGFASVVDPCVVPTEARIPSLDPSLDDTYDPTQESRSQTTLDNCAANGVDPTALGLDGTLTQYSVEVLRKGGQTVRLEIDPETSTSYTYGAVIDQQFFDNFTLRFGVTYFDIEVEDSISLLGTQFVINDCYVENENNTSAFCRFLTRDADNLLDVIDSSFINVNEQTSRGIDYNLYFQKDIIINDRNLDLEVDMRVTRLLENLFRFGDAEEDDAGTPIAPEWEGTLRLTARYNDFRFNWRANYISGEQDSLEAFSVNPACETLSQLCRPVADTDYYWTHSASVTWAPRDWTFTLGIVNMFDEEPPLVDTDAPETQLNNIPLGAGYDILGRRAFFSVRKSFGG